MATDFATPGKVLSASGGVVTFVPRGTTYELHLRAPGAAPALNVPVDAIIRVQARKVWTVPSGGLFVSPIFGPPKIIQGRVRHVDEKQLVVQAGATFVVDLPADDTAVDLPNGAIAVGAMVNVTAMPGATVEFAGEKPAAPTPEVRTVGSGPGSALP